MTNRFCVLIWLLIPAVFYTSPVMADNPQTIVLEFEYGNGLSKQFKSIEIDSIPLELTELLEIDSN